MSSPKPSFIPASAAVALNSVEKLRRLAMLWNPSSQAGFHLLALSDFRGPPLPDGGFVTSVFSEWGQDVLPPEIQITISPTTCPS